MLKLEVARNVFPFDREILIGPAQLYYRNKIVDNNTLYYYNDALKYDPYSVQFLGVAGQLEFLTKNKNEAILIKRKLEKIAPNSNALKRINDIMKGLK